MYREKSERGPKITKISGLTKLLERLEKGGFVLDRKKQMALPGGLSEDDLNVQQYIQAVKILIKEAGEKTEPVVPQLN